MDDYDINKELMKRLDLAEIIIKYADIIISGESNASTKMFYERCLDEWKRMES